MSPAQPQPAREKKQSPTTDQARAQAAWQAVQANLPDGYVQLSKAIPSMIMGSGLLQTIAFLGAKKEPAHVKLLRDFAGSANARTLINDLMNCNPAEYRAATEEAFAKLRWLRHFAAVAQKTKQG